MSFYFEDGTNFVTELVSADVICKREGGKQAKVNKQAKQAKQASKQASEQASERASERASEAKK